MKLLGDMERGKVMILASSSSSPAQALCCLFFYIPAPSSPLFPFPSSSGSAWPPELHSDRAWLEWRSVKSAGEIKKKKSEQSDAHTFEHNSFTCLLYLCVDQSQTATAGAIMKTDGRVQRHHKSFHVSN